ncbi:hypothetical protein C8J57DRAFT_1363381 [Mycena rebaudengoi]|nr:hypothetical protein C8J57DRAFT_1363381 [Mycena rebaudengoi]
MSLSLHDAYRLHISGSTFNDFAGGLNQYHVAGDLVQSKGENGRNISGDAFHNSEQRFPPPMCHPQTRVAVQDKLALWGRGQDSSNVMWLSGPAGAGKSAIAQTMAETWDLEQKLAAAFFFARWRSGGSSGQKLFPTIAYQLALHIPHLRVPIGLAVEADPAITDKSLEKQVRSLILQPLGTLPKPMQQRIVKMISEMSTADNFPLRFLICSRPEPHLREAFDSTYSTSQLRRLVLDDSYYPGDDIRRYLRDRFRDIQMKRFPTDFGIYPPWPLETDIELIVRKSSGQFIYAATVIKFVDDEYSHPFERLQLVMSLAASDNSIFADLDALYTHILSANPNLRLLVRILGAYFTLPSISFHGTHRIAFLDEILGLPRGSVRFALRGVHSLLFIPDSDHGQIWLHHRSLYDFLLNPERARKFYISTEAHNKELMDCFLNPQHYSTEMIAYTHHHWISHLIKPKSDQVKAIRRCLQDVGNTLLSPTLPVLCRDKKAMTLTLVRIIDFLTSTHKSQHFPRNLRPDRTAAWETLLSCLFEPTPEILAVFEAWGVDGYRIYSSLGTIVQRLWGTYEPNVFGRNEMLGFIHKNPPLSVGVPYRTAEIALRLLACRTAELQTCSYPPPGYNFQEYILACHDYYLSRLGQTHWGFVSIWCSCLVDAPPAPELLAMLRRLIQGTLIVPEHEVDMPALKHWLKKFGAEAEDLIVAFTAAYEQRSAASDYVMCLVVKCPSSTK